MGNKGGGRKGFVKAAAATRSAEPEPDNVEAEPTHAAPAANQETPESSLNPNSSKPQDSHNQNASPPNKVASLAKGESETKGQMLQRHKKEVKLQKETTKKLGKKQKDEAARLEAELEVVHNAELAALQQAAESSDDDEQSQKKQDILSADLYSVHLDGVPSKQVPTKAQKRREKVAAEAAARDARIAAEQGAAGDSERVQEERALEELLLPLGLVVHSIPADGHCLYRAVEDQLKRTDKQPHDQQTDSCNPPGDPSAPPGDTIQSNVSAGRDATADGLSVQDYAALRQTASDWMREHPDDFMPFISQDEAADKADDSQAAFEQYCDDVAHSAAWGGELELTALAHSLSRSMVVHSVGMPAIDIGPQFKGQSTPLQVCYLRHAFGLGEHYNSVAPLTVKKQ